MTTENGWIKIHRRILDWGWFSTGHTFKVFAYLLLAANFRDSKFRTITVKRGQVITSFGSIAKKTGISVREARTCVNRLKSTSEVTSQSTSSYQLLTICNYDTYQDLISSSDKPIDKPIDRLATSERQAIDKRATTSEEEEELKNEKNELKTKEILDLSDINTNDLHFDPETDQDDAGRFWDSSPHRIPNGRDPWNVGAWGHVARAIIRRTAKLLPYESFLGEIHRVIGPGADYLEILDPDKPESLLSYAAGRISTEPLNNFERYGIGGVWTFCVKEWAKTYRLNRPEDDERRKIDTEYKKMQLRRAR